MKSPRDALLSIMTWNIYMGVEVTRHLSASFEQIPERVTEVFRQFLATNFPRRAEDIVHQIASKKPDIIGIQEVALWELIPPNSQIVTYDFLDILLRLLSHKNINYKLAAVNRNFEVKLPDSFGNQIHFMDRDIILVRDNSNIEVKGKQEANFKTNFQIQIAGQSIVIPRGWSSIDVCIQGQMMRIVNTHLDPSSPEVQLAQANELLEYHGSINLPLAFIGDFNSNSDGSGTKTYGSLVDAGFDDTWIIAGKGNGFTCCQDTDLKNDKSNLSRRIDLILIKNKNNWNIIQAEVVGGSRHDKKHSKLWPSDHAGVVVKLELKTS